MNITVGAKNNSMNSGMVVSPATPAGGLNLGIPTSEQNTPSTGGIQLTKGQKISLTKTHPGLDSLIVGLGWDVNNFGGASFDLDTQVFLLDAQGKVVSQNHVVFYNNLVSPDGAVQHTGDNRTGDKQGDDETILVSLSRISPEVQKLVFTATIDQAQVKNQNFGQVANAYIRVINKESNQELARFDLSEDHSSSISLVVGEVYRHQADWKFGAVGLGSSSDLAGLCASYGAM